MVTLKDILEYNDDEIANLVKFYFPNNEAIEKSEEFELFKEANEKNIEIYKQKLNDYEKAKEYCISNKEKLDEHEEIKKNYLNNFIEKTKKVFAKNIKSLNQYIKNNDSLDQINNDKIIFYLLNYESYHDGCIFILLYKLYGENLTEKFIDILKREDEGIIDKISTYKDVYSFMFYLQGRKNDIVNYVKEYELKIENPSSVDKKNEDFNNEPTEDNHNFVVITPEDCEQFELLNIDEQELPKEEPIQGK